MRSFFTGRFPRLILTAYAFGLTHCDREPHLAIYFPDSAKNFPFSSSANGKRKPGADQSNSTSNLSMLQVKYIRSENILSCAVPPDSDYVVLQDLDLRWHPCLHIRPVQVTLPAKTNLDRHKYGLAGFERPHELCAFGTETRAGADDDR